MAINPYDKAHELARAIKGSEVYQRYAAASQRLRSEPETEQKLIAFRQLQMELSQAQMAGEALSETKAAHLSLTFGKLREDPVTAEFMEAEELFIRVYSDIQNIIQHAVESDLSIQEE